MRLAHSSIAVPHTWDGSEKLSRVIETWRASAPNLLPKLADDHEPVRRDFDPTQLDRALGAWNSRLWIFRRTNPVLRGSFLGSFGHTNSTAHFTLPRPADVVRYLPSLQSLTLALAQEFEADLAIVHVLTEAETAEAVQSRRPDVHVVNRVSGAVDMSTGFSKQLELGLPTLYWHTLFGPRYEQAIGMERLLAAPWARIERCRSGLSARVTVDPPDERNWPTFESARNDIMDHLGRDLFWPNARRVPQLGLVSD